MGRAQRLQGTCCVGQPGPIGRCEPLAEVAFPSLLHLILPASRCAFADCCCRREICAETLYELEKPESAVFLREVQEEAVQRMSWSPKIQELNLTCILTICHQFDRDQT